MRTACRWSPATSRARSTRSSTARPGSWSTRPIIAPSRRRGRRPFRPGAGVPARKAGREPAEAHAWPRIAAASKPSSTRFAERAAGEMTTRVLYVNQTAQVSGAERSLLALLDSARPARSTRCVACPAGELADELAALGCHDADSGTRRASAYTRVHTSRGLLDIGRSALRCAAARAPSWRPTWSTPTRPGRLAAGDARPPRPPADRSPTSATGSPTAGCRGWSSAWSGAAPTRRRQLDYGRPPQFDGCALRRPLRVIHNPVDLAPLRPGGLPRRRGAPRARRPGGAEVLSVIAQTGAVERAGRRDRGPRRCSPTGIRRRAPPRRLRQIRRPRRLFDNRGLRARPARPRGRGSASPSESASSASASDVPGAARRH